MTKKQNENGKAFQQKVTDDELKKMVRDKLDGKAIIEKTGMKSYSLQNRLFKIASETKDASYCIILPDEIEFKTVRKSRGIHISKAICESEEIAEGTKFEIAVKKVKNGKSIVLTPAS